ncbi:MAG TPA: hypothetical protein EYP85_02015, partial [Armatimonadetes bacterium]|nr:hypothetical protein [Armatimonadota bacterium]
MSSVDQAREELLTFLSALRHGEPGPRRERLWRGEEVLHRSALREVYQTYLRQWMVSYLLREGGYRRQTLFLQGVRYDGLRLSDEPARTHFRLTVTEASWEWLYCLQQLISEGKEETASWPQPRSEGDLLMFHLAVEALLRNARQRRRHRTLLPALVRASPVTWLMHFDWAEEGPETFAHLTAFMENEVVFTYLREALVRAWLAVEAKRERWPVEVEAAVNARQVRLFRFLYDFCLERGATQHLVLFVHYYSRLLRWRGGAEELLAAVRAKTWGCDSYEERETFERGYGDLFSFGETLTQTAEGLSRLGWDLTAADKYFLGEYRQVFAPLAE